MFLTRYRFLVPAALLLFAVVLAFADRRGSAGDSKPVVSAATTATTATTATAAEEPVPADVNDRPLVLPDR